MKIFSLNKYKTLLINILYYFNLNKKSTYNNYKNYNNYNSINTNNLLTNINSNDCIKWLYEEYNI